MSFWGITLPLAAGIIVVSVVWHKIGYDKGFSAAKKIFRCKYRLNCLAEALDETKKGGESNE